MNRIKSVNIIFLITVIVSVIGSIINSFIFSVTRNLAYIMIVSQVLIALPSLIYLKVKKIDLIKGLRLHKINIGNIVLIILFTYLISPLMGLINILSTRVVSNSTEQIMSQMTSENSFLVSLVLIAFVPCILEEVVYRGVFYNEYRKVNVLKGILLSGFLFGIIHGNFNQFSYAFAMGIIFALLIEATDSILSTMIVHFFINGTSVFGVYLLPKLEEFLAEFNGQEYADTAMNTSAAEKITMGMIGSFAIYAAFTSTLAFIVFKTIAKRTGRWEFIKNILKRNQNTTDQPALNSNQNTTDHTARLNYAMDYEDEIEMDYNRDVEYIEASSKNLISVSLVVAIVLCVILMILNEESVIRFIQQMQA
ncbi:MAG: lysostaphin resistance A-like protein [Anaerocolumna sp.]